MDANRNKRREEAKRKSEERRQKREERKNNPVKGIDRRKMSGQLIIEYINIEINSDTDCRENIKSCSLFFLIRS